jgi:hypothetical protein
MNLIKLPKKFQMFWDFEVPITNFCVPWFGNGAHEHMTFMCKNFQLTKKNNFYMISITQSWDTKFMIPIKKFNVKMHRHIQINEIT